MAKPVDVPPASSAEQRRIELQTRKLFEAGVDYRRWMYVKGWADRRFGAAVDDHKRIFDFIRMIVTTAIVVAVVLYYFPTATPSKSVEAPASQGEQWFALVIYLMTLLGLCGIALTLMFATHSAAVYFGVTSAARSGDYFQLRFTKNTLDNLSGFVTGCVLFSVLAIGASLANQAIKRSEQPVQKIEDDAHSRQ